ncbi:MAG: TetR family transcriptional regulator, partial [Betaproteobacteria bacterium]|nr:TetR family transcriptional regulator [Betaproteobacteria bacterium]NDF05299.1 TetR family transcriptional regulator [Betaproteobacteria bacterium]
MASKAPRQTAERILASALGLFNRFGEPNVAATMVA